VLGQNISGRVGLRALKTRTEARSPIARDLDRRRNPYRCWAEKHSSARACRTSYCRRSRTTTRWGRCTGRSPQATDALLRRWRMPKRIDTRAPRSHRSRRSYEALARPRFAKTLERSVRVYRAQRTRNLRPSCEADRLRARTRAPWACPRRARRAREHRHQRARIRPAARSLPILENSPRPPRTTRRAAALARQGCSSARKRPPVARLHRRTGLLAPRSDRTMGRRPARARKHASRHRDTSFLARNRRARMRRSSRLHLRA